MHVSALMVIARQTQTQVFRIMFHTAFVGTLLRCGKSDMDWAFVNKQYVAVHFSVSTGLCCIVVCFGSLVCRIRLCVSGL